MAYERVNWENLPSTNTPVNATNLNKMDAGIANAVENLDKLSTYSTNETKIGTWISGKPIYRRVFEGTIPSTGANNSANVYLDTKISADDLVNVGGYILSNNNKFQIPSNSATSFNFQWSRVIIASTNLRLDVGSYFYSCTFKVWIDYTKTTD